MKLEGKILGIFRDINTGEITKTVTGENHFQDSFLASLCNNAVGTGEQLANQLFISSTNPGAQRRDWGSVPNSRGGSTIPGFPSPETYLEDAPGVHLGQYLERFAAPAEDFTINMVGLCGSISNGSTTSTDTAVWLTAPCIQTTTETLDLYYRVQLQYDVNWHQAAADSFSLSKYEAQELARYFFRDTTVFLFREGMTTARTYPLSKVNMRKLDEPPRHSGLNTTLPGGSLVHSQNNDLFKRTETISWGIEDEVGNLVGLIAQNDQSTLGFKVLSPGVSPIQSVFGHRSTSTTPFYSAATTKLGLGTLTINGDSWTDPDFPKYLRLDITTSGATGVAEYKFRMRNTFGFNGNTFWNVAAYLPWTSFANGHYAGNFAISRDGLTNASSQEAAQMTFPKRYKGLQTFFIWNDSFCISDITSGEGVTFDNTTIFSGDVLPLFQASNISQITVAPNDDIYISCKDTGLYRIAADLVTLTVIDNTTPGLTNTAGCQAVCMGNGGRLWAYFDHTTTPTLYYSDDAGANWVATTLSDVFLDANPAAVVSLTCDVNDVNGKLAILYYEDPAHALYRDVTIKWWDQLAGTVSQGPNVRRHQINTYDDPFTIPVPITAHNYWAQEILKCSPNDSIWAACSASDKSTNYYPTFFTFGADTRLDYGGAPDLLTDTLHTHFIQDSVGADALFGLTKSGYNGNTGTYGTNVIMVRPNLTYETFDTNDHASNSDYFGEYSSVYYGEGVFLFFNWSSSAAKGEVTESNKTRINHMLLASVCANDEADYAANPSLEQEVYPEYGWNGSAWVKGEAAAKLTHAGAEALIDGVTVAWNDTAGGFLDSDHYTCGIFDGIWMDGSTNFDFTWELYFKPSAVQTDVESATLPNTTKVANFILEFSPDTLATDFVDDLGVYVPNPGTIDATGTAGVYNSGLRSAAPAIVGDAISFLPNNTPVPDSEIKNAQGWVSWKMDYETGEDMQAYIGVSPIDRLGTALSKDDIAYGFHMDSEPGAGGTPGLLRIAVVESVIGVLQERAFVTDIPYSANNDIQFRIILLTNGSIRYEYYPVGETWLLLYESPPGSVTIENLYLDIHIVPQVNRGLTSLTYHYLDTSNPDYYMYLGNGTTTGVFTPDFLAVDPDTIVVTIDHGAGPIEAVNVGNSDSGSVLASNSYSVFQDAGVIRFSASDINKPVTASYTTISHT